MNKKKELTEHPVAKYLREEEISPVEFARRCGIATQSVYRILKGMGNPRLSLLYKIKKGSNEKIRIDEILEYESQNNIHRAPTNPLVCAWGLRKK